MATPTRSQAVSTPKNPLSTTPSRPMTSPRTGASAVGYKTLAYKSPAVKTPASLHGHGQHLSVSSQPSSTPLAAVNIHDELLALNSPAAALINSIAPTGLTPLSNGQDGLGITTNPHGTSRDGQVQRNSEAERLHRIQQVADALKSKVIGRGVTRDGIERAARLQGFDVLLEEDNLTIAGITVEIEINFDPVRKDAVKDLVLKLNLSEGDEAQVQHQATDILKEDVGVGSTTAQLPLGKSLEAFANNLQYLSKLDHVDITTNCFELVGGLSHTFKRIWEEEKRQMLWRSDDQHLCNGSVGRASMDRMPRLGLSVDYWRNRHLFKAGRVSEKSGKSEGLEGESNHEIWTVRVYCEAGNPSITPLQQWTSDEVMTKQPLPEDVLDENEETYRPDWQDHNSQLIADMANEKQDQAVVDKSSIDIPEPINVRFVCVLEPEVLLPINTAIGLNGEVSMVDIDQALAVTYQQALQSARNGQLNPQDLDYVDVRWSRSLPYIDTAGNDSTPTHSYALYPATNGTELWFYPVSKLRFSHPRQLAAALPILRQHALLWNLMRTLVMKPRSESSVQSNSASQKGGERLQDKRRVRKRTNAKQVVAGNSGVSLTSKKSPKDTSLPVDISLDVMSDSSKPKLDLFAPVDVHTSANSRNHFLHLSVVVGLNGKIEVVSLDGYGSPGDTNVRKKLERMLSLTEDLGMVLQWIIEQLRR